MLFVLVKFKNSLRQWGNKKFGGEGLGHSENLFCTHTRKQTLIFFHFEVTFYWENDNSNNLHTYITQHFNTYFSCPQDDRNISFRKG